MRTEADYKVRAYREGDEKEINDLFNLIFNKNRSLDEWYWLFRDNLNSERNLTSVAEAGGKIIALHANVPGFCKFKDDIVMVGQPVDNLVHPDFRGMRITKDVHGLSYDFYAREGMSFGFGFPNKVYYKVGKRWLKYEDLCPIFIMLKRLNLRLAFKTRVPSFLHFLQHGVRMLSGQYYRFSVMFNRLPKPNLSIQELSDVNSSLDILWERARDRYQIMTVRDSRFLKWRFADKADGPYDILMAQDDGPAGYVILKTAKKGDELVGYIADILSINRSVDHFLIGAALSYFAAKGVDYCLCRIVREDEVYEALLDYGFDADKFSSTPVIYQMFDKGIDLAFFRDPKNWHLTYCDQIDAELE